MIDDPEEEAWRELEAKHKPKQTKVTDRMALQIAHNALSAIDRETPYPIAKHALMVINEVLIRPVQDWEAIAGDQAMTIAMLQSDIEHSLARVANALDIADRAYFAGKQDGIAETLAQPEQEPVAEVHTFLVGSPYAIVRVTGEMDLEDELFLAAPPSKPWVDLTNDEAAECWTTSAIMTWKRIQDKLREKNNG